jgi:type II secretion system protein J
MRTRRGFTLFEVTIALVLSSVVVLLAYATLRAGTDVQERITRAREADATMVAMRAMLSDALRHAVVGDGTTERTMRSLRDARGETTSLSFTTRGILPPLGASDDWRVTLRRDGSGVLFAATSLDAPRAPLRITLGAVRALAVRFLPREDAEWRDDWSDSTRLPAAVEVRFLDADGRDALAAVIARTSPVSGT